MYVYIYMYVYVYIYIISCIFHIIHIRYYIFQSIYCIKFKVCRPGSACQELVASVLFGLSTRFNGIDKGSKYRGLNS